MAPRFEWYLRSFCVTHIRCFWELFWPFARDKILIKPFLIVLVYRAIVSFSPVWLWHCKTGTLASDCDHRSICLDSWCGSAALPVQRMERWWILARRSLDTWLYGLAFSLILFSPHPKGSRVSKVWHPKHLFEGVVSFFCQGMNSRLENLELSQAAANRDCINIRSSLLIAVWYIFPLRWRWDPSIESPRNIGC